MNDGPKRLAFIRGGGILKEIAEVAWPSGDFADSTHSTQPSAQVGRHRGYLDELLADQAEIDGVAPAGGGGGSAGDHGP